MMKQQAANSADNVVRAGSVEKAANDLLAVLKDDTVSIEIPGVGVGVGSDVFFLLLNFSSDGVAARSERPTSTCDGWRGNRGGES